MMKIYDWIKAGLDYLGALAMIVAFSPILVLISLIVKFDSKGPVLFKQRRVGKNNIIFYIYKFRTMRIDSPSDVPTHLLQDSKHYITRIGKYLRKSSLDELPQLFNVIKGEMSFVGPRPALWNQFDLIRKREKLGVNKVKPGITGWAQINGRDEISIDMKSSLDHEYVTKKSLYFDLKCLILTIYKVLRKENITD